MTEEIIRALSANPNVHDWQIRTVKTESEELYLIGDSVESRRGVTTASATVTLYHDKNGKRGSTTLTFQPGDLRDVEQRVEKGVFMASLTGNPSHDLPGPAQLPEVNVFDPALANDADGVLSAWAGTVTQAVKSEPRVRLSAAEFFIHRNQVGFRNSRGATYSFPSTKAFIEMVLLSSNGTNESENYYSFETRSLEDVDLSSVVRERAQYARDMLDVSMTRKWNGAVVIDGKCMGSLFEPFLARANGEYLYRGVFKTKAGDNLFGATEVTGDPLNIVSDSTLPMGVASAPADGEGLAARRVNVLERGRVKEFLATKRYADYLGMEPTGAVSNILVSGGTVPLANILQGPVYYLVSFADLRANPVTGEFVSEVRLGYEIGADGKRKPIKGGSVAGNVLQAFAHANFSKELVVSGNYRGPRAVRFDSLTVSGE